MGSVALTGPARAWLRAAIIFGGTTLAGASLLLSPPAFAALLTP